MLVGWGNCAARHHAMVERCDVPIEGLCSTSSAAGNWGRMYLLRVERQGIRAGTRDVWQAPRGRVPEPFVSGDRGGGTLIRDARPLLAGGIDADVGTK